MEVIPDYLFKIILIGDSGVGKTSLMRRYTDATYTTDSAATIGVDFKVKTIKIEGKIVKLQIWDTAGQEKFKALTGHYYRGSNAILLVFDLSSKESFDHLRDWIVEIEKRNIPKDTPKRILGNKVDRGSEREVFRDEIDKFMEEYEIPKSNFCEVSAQKDINVESTFVELAKSLMKECKDPSARISSKISFKYQERTRKSGCC